MKKKFKHLIVIGHPDHKSFCYNGIYKTIVRQMRKHKENYKVIDLYEDKLHNDRNDLIKEYQDMNRRMSQALLWSSIPIPGITHYYAGDIKKAKKLFYIGLGGFVCITVGALSLEDAEWPKNKDNYFIQNMGQDNERWFEKIPTSVHISESGEELIHYNLKEIQKESSGGGKILIFTGLAIILGDFAFDRIVGLRLIEQKRDKVRYKYGQKLDFSFAKGFLPYKQQIGFKLNFNFG